MLKYNSFLSSTHYREKPIVYDNICNYHHNNVKHILYIRRVYVTKSNSAYTIDFMIK